MKYLIHGFLIGIANIIPGVSGGTFALILGIYPRLLKAIGTYNARFFLDLAAHIKKGRYEHIKTRLFNRDAAFLLQLLIGMLASIVILSTLLKYLLETRYELTYGFFTGLIVFSLAIPYRLLDRKRIPDMLWMVVGAALTLYISVQVNPATKILEKSLHYQSLLNGAADGSLPGYNLLEYASIFFIGAIATSAMVLPGISGSFVLLLFGKYYLVISALSRLQHLYPDDIIFISTLAAGCLLGLVGFVKILNYVYERAKNQTIWFLIGLMIGSLHALWPFKQFQIVSLHMKINNTIAMVPGYKLYSNQLRLWNGFQELWPVLILVALGGAIMIFFSRYDRKESAVHPI